MDTNHEWDDIDDIAFTVECITPEEIEQRLARTLARWRMQNDADPG